MQTCAQTYGHRMVCTVCAVPLMCFFYLKACDTLGNNPLKGRQADDGGIHVTALPL